MIIIGITFKPTHPSAAIIVDGKIVAAISEERFNRKKGGGKEFPKESIKFCLEKAGVKAEKVDYVVGSFNYPIIKEYYQKAYYITKMYRNISSFEDVGAFSLYHKLVDEMETNVKKMFGDNVKFEYVDHHLAHAASAYHSSGYKDANVITMDGRGELNSTALWVGKEGNLEKIHEEMLPNSLGILWQGVTKLLNWIPNQDEGKVMGLATYGSDKFYQIFKDNVILTKNGYEIKFNVGTFYNEGLEAYFKPRKDEHPINDYYEHIASALQRRTEDVMHHLVSLMIEKTGNRYFCLAGGVALNCSMNGEIIKRDDIEGLYIQAASSDEGASLGAAQWKYFQVTGKVTEPMKHALLGKSYSDNEIEEELKRFKLSYRKCEDIAGEVAKKLHHGKIVAWFQGRCEFGPRALGARSVLGNPSLKNMKQEINDNVKYREDWRPFALSMLDEYKGDYLENAKESPFMILRFTIKEEAREKLVSGTHVDGSTRPQTVKKETNPLYYEMIKKFGDLSGVYAVLNTSFNVKGEPLILRPIEAIRDFYASGVDVLAIGNFLLEKMT